MMNKCYTFSFLFSLSLLFLGFTTQAQTNWFGTIDNNWFNASNWSNGLPAAGNNAQIFGSGAPEINANLTVDYSITVFGTLTINAAVANNAGGSILVNSGTLNLGTGGTITNLGTISNNGGDFNLSAGAVFNNNEGAMYSSNGASQINNSGTLNLQGGVANLGTLINDGSVNTSAAFNSKFTNNNSNFQIDGGLFTTTQGGTFNNAAGATLTITNTGSVDNQGTLTNEGTIVNNGAITNKHIIENNNQFNNNFGGSITNLKTINFNTGGTFNNNNNASLTNEDVLNNGGLINNSGFFDNGSLDMVNLVGGSFINTIGGTLNNQFGATWTNNGNIANEGTIETDGTINNNGTLTNNNFVFTNSGGTLHNTSILINNNTMSNMEFITNTGTFTNAGVLSNASGGKLINDGNLINEASGRISNDFDLINNTLLQNLGSIENGLNLFNNGTFDNDGILSNIGIFDNNPTGTFNNTVSGIINNEAGGIISNYGQFNNDNEIFNFVCAIFANHSVVNNNHWFSNYGILFNYGTFNGTIMPANSIVITDATSTQICEDIQANLDLNGEARILGTSVSVTSLDTCTDLTLTVNDQTEIIFTCADLGENIVTLELLDRTGNAAKCTAKVTIIDNTAPIIENCPVNIVVQTNGIEAPVEWIEPTATDVCGTVTKTQTHFPGDLFPVGTTQVDYTFTDQSGNASSCIFNVTVIQNGDCVDILSVREVSSTYDNCGNWCGAYAMALGNDQCYEASDNLLFIEYRDGTALLTGDLIRNGARVAVYVVFSGFTSAAPTDSPKYGLCVNSGGETWTYYTTFNGWLTFEDCTVLDITRMGPAFQMGMGGNLQDPNLLGGSAWFQYNGGSGDFNFRLSDPIDCAQSVWLEAECAAHIGSKWSVKNDASASNGTYLLPPASISYDLPPATANDLVTFEFEVNRAGAYRIYTRSLAASGDSDSYWVRVNNGTWVKWNKVNFPNQGNTYEWDQVGEWLGGLIDIPLTFDLVAGANKIDFAWREPNIRLDKIFVTLTGAKPTGIGEVVDNCDVTPPPTGDCQDVTIKIVPDNYGSDITWELKNSAGDVLYSGGPYQDYNTTAIITHACLPVDCYEFKIYDVYGDGLCCQWGSGYYEIKKQNGQVLGQGAQYTYADSRSFCIDDGDVSPEPCNRTALFVVGNSALNYSDASVKSRLEGLGFTVIVKDDDYVSTTDSDGLGLILISSTTQSTKVNTKFKDVAIPVITWESWLYDDMKMTGTSSSNYGTFSSTSQMTIGEPNHPIVQGLTGNVTIFNGSKTIPWGNPSAGASRLGYLPGEPTCSMLFTYEEGAGMVGMTAPARRAGMYLYNESAHCQKNISWMIFDNTVNWALGCDNNGGNNIVIEHDVLNFEAIRDDRQVNLYWTNNTSYKNEFLVLEKSMDGQNFETIEEMYAFEEEDKSMKVYEDVDMAPEAGTNYYRVKVIYLDGSFDYSPIRQIDFNEIADFEIYPNPAVELVKVNVEDFIGQTITIQLHDLNGHLLMQEDIEEVNTLTHEVNLNEYYSGQYLLSVTTAGKKPVTKKLFIAK